MNTQLILVLPLVLFVGVCLVMIVLPSVKPFNPVKKWSGS